MTQLAIHDSSTVNCENLKYLENSLLAAGSAVLLVFGLMISPSTARAQIPWNVKQLSAPPHLYPADDFHEEGVSALFYEGLPWRGNPTRVFAWYGVPKNRPRKRLPAMVLVHGGEGTAFANWVRLWNARGYAAIAIDTCGSVPIPARNNTWQRSPLGGPPCWAASFDQIGWAERDQWTYHAIADIVLANSLLRSFPQVDAKRIAITGISWGGYLTAISASLDQRFRFAAPVYGCGFLGEDSYWVPEFKKMGEAKARKWLDLWDPSVYLSRANMPILWVDGTNDQFYPLDSLQKSPTGTTNPVNPRSHAAQP
jgi:dienelactone hydrolase